MLVSPWSLTLVWDKQEDADQNLMIPITKKDAKASFCYRSDWILNPAMRCIAAGFRLCVQIVKLHPTCILLLKRVSNNRKRRPADVFSIIGVTGFEPAASWSRTKHSTGLSHTPITVILYHGAGVLSISNTQKVRFKIAFLTRGARKRDPRAPFSFLFRTRES